MNKISNNISDLSSDNLFIIIILDILAVLKKQNVRYQLKKLEILIKECKQNILPQSQKMCFQLFSHFDCIRNLQLRDSHWYQDANIRVIKCHGCWKSPTFPKKSHQSIRRGLPSIFLWNRRGEHKSTVKSQLVRPDIRGVKKSVKYLKHLFVSYLLLIYEV